VVVDEAVQQQLGDLVTRACVFLMVCVGGTSTPWNACSTTRVPDRKPYFFHAMS
jgi:hypothetical protein